VRRRRAGHHEDACADDATDPDHDELKRTKRPVHRGGFAFAADVVDRLSSPGRRRAGCCFAHRRLSHDCGPKPMMLTLADASERAE
jgi:hypothetical protein